MTIEARIAAYLDGELDDCASTEVEAALIDPAVGQLLSEELMLREFLASMSPARPPDELIARLEDSLGVGERAMDRVRSQLGAALAGLDRALRGPALAATRVSLAGARVAISSASTVRYSVGLVADIQLLRLSPSKPKPMWRQAAFYLWRRRK